MTTVASRSIRSSPHRDAADTWRTIVSLLTRGAHGSATDELLSVTGTTASVIADQAAKDAAIVVICEGPRSRIYCLYNEDAVDGADANEEPFGFDPLKGDWSISLPCEADDLEWVQRSLKQKSNRITARDKNITFAVEEEEEATAKSDGLVLDLKGLLGQ